MSLAVAIWESAGRYELAADTRLSSHIANMQGRASKVFRRGPWLGAWVGEVSAAQAFVRALGPLDTLEPDAIDAALRAARDVVLTTHAGPPADGPRFSRRASGSPASGRPSRCCGPTDNW